MNFEYKTQPNVEGVILCWFKANQRWDNKPPASSIQRSLYLMNTAIDPVDLTLRVFFYRMGVSEKRQKINGKDYPVGSPTPIIDQPLTHDEVKIHFGKYNQNEFSAGLNAKKTKSYLQYGQVIIDEQGNQGFEFRIHLEPTGTEEITLGPFYWQPRKPAISLIIVPHIELENNEGLTVIEENMIYLLTSDDTGKPTQEQVQAKSSRKKKSPPTKEKVVMRGKPTHSDYEVFWISRTTDPEYLYYFVDYGSYEQGIQVRNKFEFKYDEVITAQLPSFENEFFTLGKEGMELLKAYLRVGKEFELQKKIPSMLRDFNAIRDLDEQEQAGKALSQDESMLIEELAKLNIFSEDEEEEEMLPDNLDELFVEKQPPQEELTMFSFLTKHQKTLYQLFLLLRAHKKCVRNSMALEGLIWLFIANSTKNKERKEFLNALEAWIRVEKLIQKLDEFFPTSTLEYSKAHEIDWVPELFLNSLLYHLAKFNQDKYQFALTQLEDRSTGMAMLKEKSSNLPSSIAWEQAEINEAVEVIQGFISSLKILTKSVQLVNKQIENLVSSANMISKKLGHVIPELNVRYKQYLMNLLTQLSFSPILREVSREQELFEVFANLLQKETYQELRFYDEELLRFHRSFAMAFITLDGFHTSQLQLDSAIIEKLISLYSLNPLISARELFLIKDKILDLKQALDKLKPQQSITINIENLKSIVELLTFYADSPCALTELPVNFGKPVTSEGLTFYSVEKQDYRDKIVARLVHVVFSKLFLTLEEMRTKKPITTGIKSGAELVQLIEILNTISHFVKEDEEGVSDLVSELHLLEDQESSAITEPKDDLLLPGVLQPSKATKQTLEKIIIMGTTALMHRERFFKRHKILNTEIIEFVLNTFNRFNLDQKLLNKLKQTLPLSREELRATLAKLQVRVIQDLKAQTTLTLATWDLTNQLHSFIFHGQEIPFEQEVQTFEEIKTHFPRIPKKQVLQTISNMFKISKTVKELVSFGVWEAREEIILIALYRILQHLIAIAETLLEETFSGEEEEKVIKQTIKLVSGLRDIMEHMDFKWLDMNIEKYLDAFIVLNKNSLTKKHVLPPQYKPMEVLGSSLIILGKTLYNAMRDSLLVEGKSILYFLNEIYSGEHQFQINSDEEKKQKYLDRSFHEIFIVESKSPVTRQALEILIFNLSWLLNLEKSKQTVSLVKIAKRMFNLLNQEQASFVLTLF